MGNATEKQRKKERAASARAARQAKKGNTDQTTAPLVASSDNPACNDPPAPDHPADSMGLPRSTQQKRSVSSKKVLTQEDSTQAVAAIPSSIVPSRRNPSRLHSNPAAMPSASVDDLDPRRKVSVDLEMTTETRPMRKTARVAQALLEQVKFSAEDDSDMSINESHSEVLAEYDEEDSLGGESGHGSSDIEVDRDVIEVSSSGQLTLAVSKQKVISKKTVVPKGKLTSQVTSVSHTKKLKNVPVDLDDDSEDHDEEGEFLSVWTFRWFFLLIIWIIKCRLI